MSEVNPGPQRPSIPNAAAGVGPPRGFLPPAPPVVLDPIPTWKWAGGIILAVTFAGALVFFVKWSHIQSHRAQAAVIALHQQMIRADDQGIFANADETYRQTITVETSNGMFDNVRARLGAPRSSTQIGRHDSTGEATGGFLTLRYFTVFEKGSGRETICFHDVGGVWKLAAYNVESPLLRANKSTIRVNAKPGS
jgi:hypothetical protein